MVIRWAKAHLILFARDNIMKECTKCGFKLPAGEIKCRFCGAKTKNVVQPDTTKITRAPQSYSKCNVCGICLASGIKKCPYCGGLCAEMGEKRHNNDDKRKRLSVRAEEPAQYDKNLTDCSEKELRELARQIGVETTADDNKDSIATQLADFVTTDEKDNDNIGNSDTGGTQD